MSSCQLNEDDFRRCCQLLLQHSDQLRDGWSWETLRGSEEGYLKKTTLRSVAIDAGQKWDHERPDPDSDPHEGGVEQQEQVCPPAAAGDADVIRGDVEDGEDDGVCAASEGGGGGGQVLQYEYHVVFSCSYGTPVLYFRAFTLEGRSLSLEEVWSGVHPNFRWRLQRSPLNTISQQEHPLLGQPFFMLHPCKTEEFMRPVLRTAQDQHRPVNYVLTWLSVVGPLLGLEVPLEYSAQPPPAAPGPG